MIPLEYTAPTTLADAIRALNGGGAGLAPLGGGTDLIIQNRTGRRTLGTMVDVKKIPELNVLTYDPEQGLRLGAAVPCAALTGYGPAQRHYPALVEGAELIGSVQIQSRATVGGNICNGSPAADSICPLIVHRATCVVAGPGGTREVPAESFMTGPGQTALAPGELLVEMRLPPPEPRSASGYLRFIPRNEMDIAVASAGAWLTFAADGRTVAGARVAIGAVAATPLLVEPAARALTGSALEPAALEAVSRAASEAAQPITDIRGTVEYRKHTAGVLACRAVELAAQRARERSP